MDPLQQELLAVFDAEYRDHLGVIRTLLARDSMEISAVSEIFRRIHSLKGAARAVGRGIVERISHDLEAMLQPLMAQQRLPDEGARARLVRDLDAIEADMEGVSPAPGVHNLPSPAISLPDGEAYVQVPLSRLEALATALHRVTAANEARDPLWRRLVECLPKDDHGRTLGRRNQDLSFSMIVSERQRVEGDITRALGRLQQEIQSIAQVHAGTVFESLAGMARRIARDFNGRDSVDVHLHGMEILADRRVMQAMRDPAIQLLRNAVVHGGETPSERTRAGKPPHLQLSLSVRHERNQLVLSVADDGRGPELEIIARQGVRQGVLAAHEHPDEERLLACVFEPGFSTRTQADELAGRGMGLSIVAEVVRALNGSVRLARGAPVGTVVTIRVPLARRNRTVLLVQVAGQTLGLDGAAIERMLWITPEEIAMIDRTRFVTIPGLADPLDEDSPPSAGRDVPLLPLACFVAKDADVTAQKARVRVVCVSVGGDVRALLVDDVIEVREMLVEDSILPGLDRLIAPDLGWLREDQPVLVLDLEELFRRWDGGEHARFEQTTPGVRSRHVPTILVVDDSITTRTLEKTILQAQGYKVLVAVDGIQALEIMRREYPGVDVVVTDVEMPRMDGFALLAALRSEPRFVDIPVVLMTSRDEASDIRRGLEGGAHAYITKQAFEQGELIATIRGLL